MTKQTANARVVDMKTEEHRGGERIEYIKTKGTVKTAGG